MIQSCHHCGQATPSKSIVFNSLPFCCNGCKTVYCLMHESELANFYSIYPKKGVKPQKIEEYTFLVDKEFRAKWETFRDGKKVQLSLSVPQIHCSACIWVLEHLPKMNVGVLHAEVDFSKKKLHLYFDEEATTLQKICILLSQLGYPPDFSLSTQQKLVQKKKKYSLWLKIGIAGFAFGNTMLLSLATYFEGEDPWLEALVPWFDVLMLGMSIPIVFYAAGDYFIQSWKSIKHKVWSLDIPIALGISVLFLKSIHNAFVLDILPYFDSLTGLVFFLLLGKYMQKRAYESFSFERDYESFFPLAVRKIIAEKEEKVIGVNEIKKGDQLVVKPNEIVPVDAQVGDKSITLDYSFVTGESREVHLEKGATVYAGGRVKNKAIEVTALKTLEQSYLIQLWNKKITDTSPPTKHFSLADRVSGIFTPTILSISMIAGVIWLFISPERVIEIITAVLIVACPCALALSSPFILGNMLRYFGRFGFYIKNTAALLRIATTDHWVFDKTGTLTTVGNEKIYFTGTKPLSTKEKTAIRSLVYQSNHPLSKAIFNHLNGVQWSREIESKQFAGLGLEATIDGCQYRIGAARFVAKEKRKETDGSQVFIAINGNYRGYFTIKQNFRIHIENLFQGLKKCNMSILSGDSPYERAFLKKITPANTVLLFEQDPFEKMNYIAQLQKHHKVLMFGDGLNDAGALKRSDAGIAISNKEHFFSPACDAILIGDRLPEFGVLFDSLQKSIRLVKISFIFSLLYNLIGISIAVLGYLSPIIAAILMPLSSLSVVLFALLSTSLLNKKLLKKLKPDNYHFL